MLLLFSLLGRIFGGAFEFWSGSRNLRVDTQKWHKTKLFILTSSFVVFLTDFDILSTTDNISTHLYGDRDLYTHVKFCNLCITKTLSYYILLLIAKSTIALAILRLNFVMTYRISFKKSFRSSRWRQLPSCLVYKWLNLCVSETKDSVIACCETQISFYFKNSEIQLKC